MKTAPLLALAALIGAGCNSSSTSHRVNYRDVVADLDARGTGNLAIAVRDRRIRILRGESESWAGLSRTAAGIAIDVNTSSGRPLARDMADSIRRSLKRRGFRASILRVSPDDNDERTRAIIKGAATRTIVMTLKVWETFTLVKTELRADLTLEVLDPDGATLAKSSLKETRVLSSAPLDIDKVTPPAFQASIEQLLNDPAVKSALVRAEEPEPKKKSPQNPYG